MARVPRGKTMDPLKFGTYHITSRCVRRAFLCGKDKRTGKDFSHRREFIEARARELAAQFAISLIFVAIMGNHLHLVLSNLPQLVQQWSDEEVMRRACKIFTYKFKMMGVKNMEPTDDQLAMLVADRELVAVMRVRLSDPSWFMKQLLQPLAWRSNREDKVRGHFVEQRFDHRVITDERGLFICGIYVDLNQIAAMEADRPERSLHTSAGMRIAGKLLRAQGRHMEAAQMDGFLLPISTRGDGQNYVPASDGGRRAKDEGFLDITLDEYLRLLDEVGRQIRPGKRGRIAASLPPILERLQMDLDGLTAMVQGYDELFPNAVGSAASLADLSEQNDGLWSRQAEAVRALEQSAAEPSPDASQPSPRDRAKRRRK